MSSSVPPSDLPSWEAIDRYLAGEASVAEAAVVGAYLSREPEVERTMRQLPAVHAERQGDSLDVGVAWRTMTARIARSVPGGASSEHRGLSVLGETTAQHQRRPPKLPRTAFLPRRVAYVSFGVLAGLLCAVGMGKWIVSTRHASTFVSPMTTYTTRNGQRADITLADGSTVSLNVGSRLEVPADYGAGNRALRLNGEALFTVTHRSGAPFSVTAGNTVTRVLGTSFVVRRYATDSVVAVAVRDGKVAVQAVPLAARQQADVTPGGRVRVRPVDAAMFAFASGTLVLDWMPLQDAIPELRRWYDAEIVVADSATLARPMKGTFAAGSVADLAAILSVTLHARIARDGRVLTVAAQ